MCGFWYKLIKVVQGARAGPYLGFECNFCFLQMPYFGRQGTILVLSTQPTLLSKLSLQLGPQEARML